MAKAKGSSLKFNIHLWVELERKVRVHAFAANHFFLRDVAGLRGSEDGSVAASLPTAARSNNSHGYEILHWL